MQTRGTPSLFWQQLAAEHTEQLGRHGYGEMKRNQALRYFTWQWRWKQARKSEQMRFLLQQTPRLDLIRAAAMRQPLAGAIWRGLPWNASDRWLYALATRLLWLYAERHGDSEVLALGEPALGNPPPVCWGGQLISQDLANSSLEAEAIRRALAGRTPRRIVEIGGGYGRTGYALLGLYPGASYTIIDIEPALSLSRFYLTSLFPDRDLTFMDADDIDVEALGGTDLAVSISSLHEMTPAQVADYLLLLDTTLTEGATVFLKQWTRWHNPADDVVMQFVEYPIAERWVELLREASPVQTAFTQAAWRVGTTRPKQDP